VDEVVERAKAGRHAEIMDVRDYWAMTCYPSLSPPYRVEMDKGTLIVTSSHGARHYYTITDQKRVPPGFTLTATDFHIDRTGFLISEKRRDVCSGDLAADGNDSRNVTCSRMANELGFHGIQRREFREACKEQPE
jgi:hypothetical protein